MIRGTRKQGALEDDETPRAYFTASFDVSGPPVGLLQ